MPIKPEKAALYPPKSEWVALRRQALERADNRCMPCGAENNRAHPETGSLVVLTTAHLDHDPTNNVWHNLKSMCQKCHNAYDAPMRRRNAAETRRAKLNNMELFDA